MSAQRKILKTYINDIISDLTPREHQVARQIMLGRRLGTAPP